MRSKRAAIGLAFGTLVALSGCTDDEIGLGAPEGSPSALSVPSSAPPSALASKYLRNLPGDETDDGSYLDHDEGCDALVPAPALSLVRVTATDCRDGWRLIRLSHDGTSHGSAELQTFDYENWQHVRSFGTPCPGGGVATTEQLMYEGVPGDLAASWSEDDNAECPSAVVDPVPLQSFYGDWSVHGSVVHFAADGTGRSATHDGFGPNEEWANLVAEYELELSPDERTLTATVVKVYRELIGAEGVVRTMPADPATAYTHVGDQTRLRFAQPNLLRGTAVVGEDAIGNPYLCNDETVAPASRFCGA